MDASFWHQRWQQNQIGFHKNEVNPLLVRYFDRLALSGGARVFVPLCGKTLDIGWLLSRGCRVAAAELSETAVEQLFDGLRLVPDIAAAGRVRRYAAAGVEVFVGDIFAIDAALLGPVDAVYDRAALVALPDLIRGRYADHLARITATAPQLLLCFVYDQRLMDGPPFSVSDDEVRERYGERYQLTRLASVDVPGGLKGRCAAREHVWLLCAGGAGALSLD